MTGRIGVDPDFRVAAAVRAQVAGSAAVIDHDKRVVAVGQLADGRQRSHVSIHRKDAIGGDHQKAKSCARPLPFERECGRAAIAARPHAQSNFL
jgi:hypothetical protein